ncbi:MAG: hypothetical protein JST68_19225 [Bacteroidetes bacterium]|nr:hypothetical protein [Bacteroidota bacterium]
MKVFLLTLASAFLVILLINVGYYGVWFREKPRSYWFSFLKEKDDTTAEEGIKNARYGISYTISMRVKAFLEKKRLPNAIVLFEPNSYYRDSLHIYNSVRAPEPAVFYYYTGLTGVWTNSPDVNKANFIVHITRTKGVTIEEIHTPERLQQILAGFKKYPPIL